MILKKPYILFIKFFKPMHVCMSALIFYLIYRTNNILTFLTNYIYSEYSVVGENIKSTLIDNLFFIIPIVLIILSLLFLGIMFNKKKPVVFYVFNIFAFLIVLIITVYNSNFLSVMEENIVSIKLVKLNHDLIFINMVIEIICFILFFIRGLGLNFKNFKFDSDISKLNISEADKEEIEVNINIDFDDSLRKRKRRLRQLKYMYSENKTIINILVSVFLILFVIVINVLINLGKKENVEGTLYSMGQFNLKVNKTLLINQDFSGQEITDNYLVIVETTLQSNLNGVSLYLADFSLNVGSAIYKPITKYNDKLLDLGTPYNQTVLSSEYTNYLLVFEISKKYLESDLILMYSDKGYINKIKLNPNSYISEEIKVTKKIGEVLNFDNSLESINFNIKNFDIKDKFLLEYNYCIKENDCIKSKEYLKPTINENFDKKLLMLEVDFNNNGKLNVSSFYDFFSKFGSIYYKIGDKWYAQNSFFEEVKSKRVKQKNKIYIGINSKISDATSIKLVFNIRNSKYEYILK